MSAILTHRRPFLGEPLNEEIILVGAAPRLEGLLNSYLGLNPLFKQFDVFFLNAVQAVYCMGPYSSLRSIKSPTRDLPKIQEAFLDSKHYLSLSVSAEPSGLPPAELYRHFQNGRQSINLDYFQSTLDFFFKGDRGFEELSDMLLGQLIGPSEIRQFPQFVELLKQQAPTPKEQQVIAFLVALLNLARVRAISLEQFFDFSTIGTLRAPLFSFSFERARSLGVSILKTVVKGLFPKGSEARLDYFKLEVMFQLFYATLPSVALQGALSELEQSKEFLDIEAQLPLFIAGDPMLQQLRLVEPQLALDTLVPNVVAIYMLCLSKLDSYPQLDRAVPASATLSYVFLRLPGLGAVTQGDGAIKALFSSILEDTVSSLNDKAWVRGLLKPISAKNAIGRDDVIYNKANCSLKALLAMTPTQIGQQLNPPKRLSYLGFLAECFEMYYEGPNVPFILAEAFVRPLGPTALRGVQPNALYLYYILAFRTVQDFVKKTCETVVSPEEIVGFNKDEAYITTAISEANKRSILELLLGMAIGAAGFGAGLLAIKISRRSRASAKK